MHGRSSVCVGLLSVIHGKSCELHVADFFFGPCTCHCEGEPWRRARGRCTYCSTLATTPFQSCMRVHACKWGRCFNCRLNISLRSCVCSQSPPTPYTQVQIITNKALSGQECRKARGALDTIATPCSPRRVLHSQPAGGNKNWRVRNVSSSRASARALSHHLVWHVPPPAIAQR